MWRYQFSQSTFSQQILDNILELFIFKKAAISNLVLGNFNFSLLPQHFKQSIICGLHSNNYFLMEKKISNGNFQREAIINNLSNSVTVCSAYLN